MNISNFEKLKKNYEDEFNNGLWNLIINNKDISINYANCTEISSNSNITWEFIYEVFFPLLPLRFLSFLN